EDRTLPSTFIVLNANDSGPDSLRADLAAAGNDDTIRFDNSLRGRTIKLTSGQLAVTASVTIDGLGEDRLAVSGSNASRVSAVRAGKTVTTRGLTITNGKAAAGGGIDNAGNLTLADCAVIGNQSVGGAGGGGILNEVGASLTLARCDVSSNKAITSVGSD